MTRALPYTDAVDGDVGDDIPTAPPTLEIGRVGINRAGGYIQDEFLPQLRGRQAVKIYREMAENSPVLGAWIYTVTQLLKQIEWRVEPASSKREDKANAERVEQAMDDMEVSWADTVGEACSMLPYGWAAQEIVFKRRMGLWAKDERHRSKYDDGQFGWRKFAPRRQDTLLRWVFNDEDDILAMVQMPAPRFQKRVIPAKRLLLYRPKINGGSPEGMSLIRTAYRPWFMIKRFEEIEAVGIERDLAGLPVAYVPTNVLNPKPGSKDAQMLAAVKQAVQAVRRNEQEGLVWPLEYDEDRNLMYDFKLLTSGGSRQFNVDATIQRYETRMLMSVMADFIMTGHENNGSSYALHTDKSGIFRTGVNGIAKAIADPINRKAIPMLFQLNGIQPKELPQLVPNNVDPPALAELAQFIMATSGAGMQWFPDGELEKFIRDAAGLPAVDEEITEAHDAQARQQAILGLAEQKMQAMQMDQQAQMGQQQVVQGAQGIAQTDQQMAESDRQASMSERQFAASRQDAKVSQQQQAQAVKQKATASKPAAKGGRR